MNIADFNRVIIYFVGLSFIFGCGSFPKRTVPAQYLNKNNINALNGKYTIKAIYSGPTKDTTSAWNFSDSDLGIYPTFFDELNNGLLVKSIKTDPSKIYTFSLKILSTKKLEFNYFEDDSIIKQNTIKYRFKDDGYVYLKHKNFKIIGIPYVFGGFNTKRNRITLNKDTNLLFETSEFKSGGLFLLMINPYSKMKYEKIYQRIE